MAKTTGRSIGLLVLCGLPGAGKTTLAEHLHKAANSVDTVERVSFLVIQYDELLPSGKEEQLISERELETSKQVTEFSYSSFTSIFIGIKKVCPVPENLVIPAHTILFPEIVHTPHSPKVQDPLRPCCI